jgi:hypothetical protein
LRQAPARIEELASHECGRAVEGWFEELAVSGPAVGGGTSDTRAWLVSGAAAVLALGALVCVYVAYLGPRVVVSGNRGGGISGNAARFMGLKTPGTAVASPELLEVLKDACREDQDLLRTWTPTNTRFSLTVEDWDFYSLEYEHPVYSVRYFSFRRMCMVCDHKKYPDLVRVAKERNERVADVVHPLVIRELGREIARKASAVQEPD